MDFWRKVKKYAWIAGMAVGVLFMMAGMLTGQFTTIWHKAVMICLECIGIG